MSKHRCYTLMEVLAEVFVNENSGLDLDAANSLS